MSKWVNVNDELPNDIFDFVLVFADGAMSTMGYSKELGFFTPYPTVSQVIIEGITHWMPLPEPPKGDV